MIRLRRLVIVGALALPLSQVGHALASALRGAGAVQPGAAHSYFASDLAASSAALLAVAAAAAAVLVAARAARGGPLPRARRNAWPVLWTFLALAGLQLELYLLQELLEGSTTIDVAWRGLIGQLPVAAIAALVIQGLSTRLGPAGRELRRRLAVGLTRLEPASISTPTCSAWPLTSTWLPAPTPRGPPGFLHLSPGS